MSTEKPYISRAVLLERAISKIEGWSFSRQFMFSTTGFTDHLCVNINSHTEVDGFKEMPGLRRLADDLNAATKPIWDAYALALRQELANECVKVAACAIGKPQ